MSEPRLKIDVRAWVEHARPDPVAYRRRQAIEVILNAIARTADFNKALFLKGGILLGLAYDSPRQTVDIDLSTSLAMERDIDERLRTALDPALKQAAANLGYDALALKVQAINYQPKDVMRAKFPALEMAVGYAPRSTLQERALRDGRASEVIRVDISFNEHLGHMQILELTGGNQLYAYGLAELMAEKYRAMLQQVVRNRSRRQDVFDLDLLISENDLGDALRAQIFEMFIEKCQSHDLEPALSSLDDPEIEGTVWQGMGHYGTGSWDGARL